MEFIKQYLMEAGQIIEQLDVPVLEKIVDILVETRNKRGRLFIMGVGGSAATSSHAVNDFRKIAGIESYTPTDNVSELTARTNDEGWESVFIEWLKISKIGSADTVLVFSVGGGDLEKMVSQNLVSALQYAKEKGTKICGIVGRDGGYTARISDACLIIPTINPLHITPHTESFHSLVQHLIVSHPRLKNTQTKWESIK